MPSFVFHFDFKNWKQNTVRFLFFVFMKELKNKLIKQIKIDFMSIITSMVYSLFKSKFVPSPLRFSNVQWSSQQQESTVYKTIDVF